MLNGRAMRWVYRTVPTLTSLVVASASFALSFVALRDVATRTKAVPGSMAWLVPLVIDGGVMCASAVIWANAAQQRKRQIFPFFVVSVLVALSVVVNAAHAGPSPLAKIIASLPPLVLLATLELVAITTRRANHLQVQEGSKPEQPLVVVPVVAPQEIAAVEPATNPVKAPKVAPAKQPQKSAPRKVSAPRQSALPEPSVQDVPRGLREDDLVALENLDDELEAIVTAGIDDPVLADSSSRRRPTRVRALGPEE